MAEKRLNFATGNKYDDHISSTAADALASAYSLNAANFTPFTLPYYNPGIFFNQNCQPVLPNLNGYSFWHTFGAPPTDYMFNITALQNIQALAAANQCGESFYDVLNKISHQNCVGNEKDFVTKQPTVVGGLTAHSTYSPSATPIYQTTDAAALNRPSSSRTYVSTPFANQLSSSSSPSSASSPHSNLVTLAEVASCLTPEIFNKSPVGKKSKSFSPPSSSSPPGCLKKTTDAELETKRKNHRKRTHGSSKSNGGNCEEKVQKLEPTQITDVSAARNLSTNNNNQQTFSSDPPTDNSYSVRCLNNFLNNNDAGKETNNNNVPTTTNCNFKLDQNLLNASAIALAALHSQWMAATVESRIECASKTAPVNSSQTEENKSNIKLSETVKMEPSSFNNVIKPKRSYRRRKEKEFARAPPSLDNEHSGATSIASGSLDQFDDTINGVIRAVCGGNRNCSNNVRRSKKSLNKAAQSLIKVDTSLISSSNKCSIDNSKEPCSEEALDLTMKKDKCIIENDGYSQFQVCADFVNELHESQNSKRSCKKRRVADTDFIRMPLSKGWRRQTCIRTISASGIRGEVIYYAPCGKRLASCGEVLRYLKKYPDCGEISRDHFSFSSKVLVGEFLEVKPNGIKKLNEDEIRSIIQSLQKPKVSANFLATCLSVANTADDIKRENLTEVSSTKRRIDEPDGKIENAVQFCVTDLVSVVSDVLKKSANKHKFELSVVDEDFNSTNLPSDNLKFTINGDQNDPKVLSENNFTLDAEFNNVSTCDDDSEEMELVEP